MNVRMHGFGGLAVLASLFLALPLLAQELGGEPQHQTLVLTSSWVGYTAIALFVLAYGLVIAEEYTHLRKSKPVMLAAGLMWTLVAARSEEHTSELQSRDNLVRRLRPALRRLCGPCPPLSRSCLPRNLVASRSTRRWCSPRAGSATQPSLCSCSPTDW